jgi:hypothetical protein
MKELAAASENFRSWRLSGLLPHDHPTSQFGCRQCTAAGRGLGKAILIRTKRPDSPDGPRGIGNLTSVGRTCGCLSTGSARRKVGGDDSLTYGKFFKEFFVVRERREIRHAWLCSGSSILLLSLTCEFCNVRSDHAFPRALRCGNHRGNTPALPDASAALHSLPDIPAAARFCKPGRLFLPRPASPLS